MGLGDESTRGRAAAGTESASLGAVSFGLASVVLATGASAQQTAEPAAELPPLEVTAKKATKKKTVAKKAPAPAASPAPLPPQEAAQTTEPAFGDGTTLTPSSGNTLQSGSGLGRLPGTLQDTPQTVNVVSQREMKERGVNTLDQALRSVPGVTVAIGEGGGGMNGDQFRIRGFQAKGDMYVDGLRDFGVYVRDSFSMEQVEVFKGPSSESFGMGTTGGAINLTQKTAHLGDSYNFEASIGTDDYYRAMVDINKQINATTAARAVALYHDQDFADRDHLYSERFGFLGSIGFGLGTDTKLTLNYMHQDGERLPDFGVPIIDPDAAGPKRGRPVTEFGVPRDNFYGKATDIDDYSVDMVTARLTAKANDWLTIHNDTRLAWYGRYFAQTVPSCSGACLTSVVDGTFTGTYSLGGPAGFDQDSWGAQNVTTAVAKFKTAGLRHELVAGVDVFYQDDERTQLGVYNSAGVLQSGTGSAVKAPGTIGSPNFRNTTGYYVARNPLSLKEGDASNVAVFASDRVWLSDTFSILGGIRYDDYEANYRATNANTGVWGNEITTNAEFFSPKASVIWEPSKQETYYASWARSQTPVGQFITNDNAGVPTGGNGPNGPTNGQFGADPEENELWEVGAKFSTYDGRLGFTAALFRVDKGNSSYTDIGSGDTITTGEEQRVQGIELGVTGSVTDAWIVQLAYSYLDSEILYNPATYTEQPSGSGNWVVNVPENANKGNKVPFVPENIFSFWTTYEISKHMPVQGKILVGGGVTYSEGYFVNAANTSSVPSNITFDAMASYELDGWRFALNGYNLSDELNYDSTMGNRAVVAPGRSAVFTIGKKF
ncbi:MAG: TonB-dependent receptor [Rhizobiales bacterium]|nr:TonB-dependent receptor [Hyphomicrobiales bacterium]